MKFVPSPLLAEKGLFIISRMKLQAVKQIAVNAQVRRARPRASGAVTAIESWDVPHSLCALARLFVASPMLGRSERHFRYVITASSRLAVLFQRDAEIIESLRQIGSEFDRSPKDANGVG